MTSCRAPPKGELLPLDAVQDVVLGRALLITHFVEALPVRVALVAGDMVDAAEFRAYMKTEVRQLRTELARVRPDAHRERRRGRTGLAERQVRGAER